LNESIQSLIKSIVKQGITIAGDLAQSSMAHLILGHIVNLNIQFDHLNLALGKDLDLT